MWQCKERYRVKGIEGCTNRHVDEKVLQDVFIQAWNSLIENIDEMKKRWERYAEFGSPLEQYRAVQFADIADEVGYIENPERDFMLKVLDHITVYESGRLIVVFMDGIEI